MKTMDRKEGKRVAEERREARQQAAAQGKLNSSIHVPGAAPDDNAEEMSGLGTGHAESMLK